MFGKGCKEISDILKKTARPKLGRLPGVKTETLIRIYSFLSFTCSARKPAGCLRQSPGTFSAALVL
jgi:hypothetical protein